MFVPTSLTHFVWKMNYLDSCSCWKGTISFLKSYFLNSMYNVIRHVSWNKFLKIFRFDQFPRFGSCGEFVCSFHQIFSWHEWQNQLTKLIVYIQTKIATYFDIIFLNRYSTKNHQHIQMTLQVIPFTIHLK